MFHTLKVKPLFVFIVLISSILSATVAASQPTASQEKDFVLSAKALAAADRFRDRQNGRKLEDLELVLGEFYEWDQLKSSFRRVSGRIVSKQRLLELLGSPDYENEKGDVWYRHSYGSTTLFFEAGYFKDRATLIEWVAYPERSFPQRMWHKVVRWTRKIGKLFKG